MPLFPYTCGDCGAGFEALVPRASAEPADGCPVCSGHNVTRGLSLLAKVAVQTDPAATNCRGDGPSCGASWCGRGQG